MITALVKTAPVRALALMLALTCVTVMLSGAAPAPASRLLPPPAAEKLITPAYLQDVLYFLSSDSMQGRYTPSRGLDIAGLYVASNVAQWGLVGAGDPPSHWNPKLGPLAQFLYHFQLERVGLNPASSITFDGHSYHVGAGFKAAAVAGHGSAPLVFVKDGYVEPGKGVDPFRGRHISGKIVVVNGEPSQMMAYQSALLNEQYSGGAGPVPVNALGRAGVDYQTPQAYAAAHGALAVISGNLPLVASTNLAGIAPKPSQGNPNPYPGPTPNVAPMVVTRFQPPEPKLPSIVAGASLWRALQNAKRVDGSDARLRFNLGVSTRTARTQDVIAVLPGSNPVLRHQYVIFSAHLDHLGVAKQPVDGDAIFNGADDDGSGSTALLALAKAFAAGPRPKRSLVFIWHAGEEEGLWGSLYFTRYPTLPLSHVVTEINMDMIGRSKPAGDLDPRDRHLTGPDEIYAIGPEVSSSDLEHTLDAVNAATVRLKLNHLYDRTNDPEQIFYRSDQFNYAAHGIPILFLFDGVHRDYHRVSDEPQKIDYAKIARVAHLVYALGWQLANQPSQPRLDAHLPAALVHAMAEARAGDLYP